jgi:PIN domain nuclease of toxin-antitoxin system
MTRKELQGHTAIQDYLDKMSQDPFDRLIIWQAIQQKMHLISKDRSFKDFKASGLRILW